MELNVLNVVTVLMDKIVNMQEMQENFALMDLQWRD